MPAENRLAELNAKFGRDPEALEWARLNVGRLRDKYRGFEQAARQEGRHDQAASWRKLANMLQVGLIGGSGCSITPFDERRPSLPDLSAMTREGNPGDPAEAGR
jgi:hypothetical protein